MTSRLFLGALLAISAACSSSSSPTALCATSGSATLTVSVVNDTNEPINICDATVTAKGPSTVTLKATGGQSASSCAYEGTLQAGDYTVTATAAGYEPAMTTQILQGGCNATAEIQVTPTM